MPSLRYLVSKRRVAPPTACHKNKRPAGAGGPASSDEIRDVELRAQSCRSAQRAVMMVDVVAARGGEHLRLQG